MTGALLVVLVLAVFVAYVIARTAVVVPQQSAFVVERLGRYSGTLGAGFHLLLPFIDVIRYRHSLKETAVDIPEQVCITRDNVQVHVDGVLYLQVINAERAFAVSARTNRASAVVAAGTSSISRCASRIAGAAAAASVAAASSVA